MNDDGYYVPLTINDLIDGIKDIIDKSKQTLTGNEYITKIEFIDEEDYINAPPGSIAIHIKQGTLDPDAFRYGTIIVVPVKTRLLM